MKKSKVYITYILAAILIFASITAITYYINIGNFSRNAMFINRDVSEENQDNFQKNDSWKDSARKSNSLRGDSQIPLTDVEKYNMSEQESSNNAGEQASDDNGKSGQESDDMKRTKELINHLLEEDAKEAELLASSALEYDLEYNKDNLDETYKKAETAISSGEVDTDMDKQNTINVLFLGIDRTEARDKTLGVYRTDTIALASIHRDTKKVDVQCIPRDTYVYIPCIDKKDKINHAYVWGGMGKKGVKSTIDTVNQFIKYSKVKYYFLIDMEPIPEIIDRIGGVEVDVEINVKDSNGENILSEGKQVLDGKKSLLYLRWRYSGGGDIGRIQRQQKFLKAVLNKLKSTGRLVDTLKMGLEYSDNMKTNINILQLFSLANLAKDINNDDINSYIVSGKGDIIDKIWYWIPDEEKAEELLVKLFTEK
jgi:LCP family protein required for cell wall assembly